MSSNLAVRLIRFTPAPTLDQKVGLLGWARVTVNDLLVLDGVVVRRSTEGRLYALLPERRDEHGRVHRIVWFKEPWARREVQRQVLAQLTESAARRQRVLAP